MPVIFNRAGNIFEVYQGNSTFRVHHNGKDILNFRVGDDVLAEGPGEPVELTEPEGSTEPTPTEPSEPLPEEPPAEPAQPVAPQIGSVSFDNGEVYVLGVTLPGEFFGTISTASQPIGGLAIETLVKAGNALADVWRPLRRGDNTILIDITYLTEPKLWLHTTVRANGLYATDQPVQIR